MKIYLVGGAVRDKLLGLPVKERDWVVVGATAEDMLKLGYRQVGKEFPVFLHPKTSEEYALARKERKVDLGYKGFTFDTSPDVSLEDDLIRRDLTINAMAETEDGQLIDPYGGQIDLQKKCLRHVSAAFSEDPVRILRIGRFLARYAHLGFHVAQDTMQLMRHMVEAGEVNALVAERVWKELERALGEKNPQKFFEVLAECGALPILFSQHRIDDAGIVHLDATTEDSLIRFAVLLHHHDLAYINAISHRYRVPNAYKELAQLIARFHRSAFSAQQFSAEELLQLFYQLDIFRREARFKQFLQVCESISKQSFAWLWDCAMSAKAYDVHELLAKGLTGQPLSIELKKKRQEKITTWLLANAKKS